MHVLFVFDDCCFYLPFRNCKVPSIWIYSHFTSTLPCICADSSIPICDTFPMPFVELKHKNTSKKQRSGSTTPRSKRCQWTSPTSFERWIRRKGAILEPKKNGALTSLDNSGWTRTKDNKKSFTRYRMWQSTSINDWYTWMFPKIVVPQIIHFNRGFPLFSPSILGGNTPLFGNHRHGKLGNSHPSHLWLGRLLPKGKRLKSWP